MRSASYVGLILVATMLSAAVAAEQYQVDPERSSLMFEAIQQDAAFQGQFPKFTANIQLDPNAPGFALKIDAEIDMAAVSTANEERDEYLLSEEFFHAKRFRKAKFKTNGVVTQGNQSVATGNLTIKRITQPVSMPFEYDPANRRLTGTVEISRLAFDVGTGMWTDTTWIADEVKVQIDVTLQERVER